MKKLICLFFILFALCPAGRASMQVSDTLSVQGGNIEYFDINAAAQEYLNMLTPEQKAQSDAYFEGGYLIMLWDFLILAAIAWIFLSLGLSAWISRIASKARRTNVKNLIYIVLYLLFVFILTFPWTVYTDYFREHKYGLSNLTFAGWLSEDMISLALLVIIGSMLIMVLYIFMRRTGKRWWIWGSGIFIAFSVFGMFISPVFIAPLFNEYKPLEEGPVKEEILSMARANGVPVDRVYRFNASKQSNRISANVSGFGSTTRVSLNDNLLNKCTLPEIKAVMGHELGHYVLNHKYKLLIYYGLVAVAGFAIVNLITMRLITRFGPRWGIKSLSDITSLPLVVFVFTLFMLIATPVLNNITRINESETDIFGLNAAREPDGFASIAIKLSEYRKIDPGRLEEIIFFDHPSGKARVMMSMRWKAENPGKK